MNYELYPEAALVPEEQVAFYRRQSQVLNYIQSWAPFTYNVDPITRFCLFETPKNNMAGGSSRKYPNLWQTGMRIDRAKTPCAEFKRREHPWMLAANRTPWLGVRQPDSASKAHCPQARRYGLIPRPRTA